MPRIDPVAADRVRQVILTSRSRGADVVSALDRAGMLRYPAKRHEDRLDLIGELITNLRAVPADAVVPEVRLPMTRLDVKNAIITFLETFQKGYAAHGNKEQ